MPVISCVSSLPYIPAVGAYANLILSSALSILRGKLYSTRITASNLGGVVNIILPFSRVYNLSLFLIFSYVYLLRNCSILSTYTLTFFVLRSIGHSKKNLFSNPVPVNVSVFASVLNVNVPLVLSNLILTVELLTTPLPSTAVAFAGVPDSNCDPEITTVGALVYPVPALVTLILVIFP